MSGSNSSADGDRETMPESSEKQDKILSRSSSSGKKKYSSPTLKVLGTVSELGTMYGLGVKPKADQNPDRK